MDGAASCCFNDPIECCLELLLVFCLDLFSCHSLAAWPIRSLSQDK